MRPGTAIGLSVLLHALVGVGAASLPAPRAVTRTPPLSAFWVTTPELARLPTSPAPTPSVPTPTPPPRARPARPSPIEAPATRAEEPAAPDTPTTRQAPAPRSTEGRALELQEARRQAAVEVLREQDRAGSYRSFTFPGTIAEQKAFEESERLRRVERGLQEPLTVFDSPAKGRAGFKETNVFGETVRWITDDCYQTTGTNNLFILPTLRDLAGTATTICTRRHARSDLFAAAKPPYLMDAEERADADAEIERRERLRRPTTGVVMSLAEE